MDTREADLRTVEFLAVDTETNGRSGDACEMTEVGAVLVGGGELHDRYESLVAIEGTLPAGIQRFTGITRAMLADAPPAADVLPRLAEMLSGRVLVAHSAGFDRRVLAQAFERCGLEWPDPPALCTVSLGRRFAPLATQRRLGPLAAHLGIEVAVAHRALPDAETCARVLCALLPKLCAHAATVADALELLAPRRRGAGRRRRRAAGPRRPAVPAAERPTVKQLPDDPGVYVFRDERGRPLYVGKSISLRARARSHLASDADWVPAAGLVDHRATNSELGALVLENRMIKELEPPGNVALKRLDAYVFVVCRLDADYPILEVAAKPAGGHAVTVGPLRGRSPARELVEQLSSLFGLRHCGRRLPRREHPSAYGQMGRCLSPCLGDLDPNLYRRRVDEALALFTGPEDGGARLLEHVEGQMHAAAADRRYERAAWLRRRRHRLTVLLGRLDGVLSAVHVRPRLVLAPHPAGRAWDAFWIVAGRVVDWGPLPGLSELERRTARALERAAGPGPRAVVPPGEVDEVRIVAAWLARHDVPTLPLGAAVGREALREFVAEATAQAARPAAEVAG